MRTLIAMIVLAGLASAAHAGNCTTNTPVNLFGQNGGNGLLSNGGVPAFDDTGAVGQIANGGDGMGTANLHGTASCPVEDNSGELLAISAALSTPIWLEHGENFAISGGLGFSGDGDTALGATGIVRIDKGISGFAGGAFSTDNSDQWAGKAGMRVGF